MGYSISMPQIIQTVTFAKWFSAQNEAAKDRILARITRLQAGNPGDWKSVGEGVNEMRIDFGAGYRLYYMNHGAVLVILLCGGTKKTQDKDIKLAKTLSKHWKD